MVEWAEVLELGLAEEEEVIVADSGTVFTPSMSFSKTGQSVSSTIADWPSGVATKFIVELVVLLITLILVFY